MRAAILSVAVFASAVAAQTSSACAAQYIVDTCLGTENGMLASCAATDYNCQCAAAKAILTCYNNCPNDSQVSSAQGQVQIYCAYASEFPSSTTAVTGTPSTTVAAVTTTSSSSGTSAVAAQSTSAMPSGSTTATAASPSKTNGATGLAVNAGGVLAALAGAVAALL